MSQPSPPPGDLPSDLVPPLQPSPLPPVVSSPLVPGGSFRVDVAEAPAAIEDLETALKELEAIRSEARRLSRVNPGSADSVSIDAAHALGLVAAGGANSLEAAVTTGIEQLQTLIDSLRADLAAYRGADSHQGTTLSRVDPS